MKTLIIWYTDDVQLFIIENLDPKFMVLQNKFVGVHEDINQAIWEELNELLGEEVDPKDVGQTDKVLLTGFVP